MVGWEEDTLILKHKRWKVMMRECNRSLFFSLQMLLISSLSKCLTYKLSPDVTNLSFSPISIQHPESPKKKKHTKSKIFTLRTNCLAISAFTIQKPHKIPNKHHVSNQFKQYLFISNTWERHVDYERERRGQRERESKISRSRKKSALGERVSLWLKLLEG